MNGIYLVVIGALTSFNFWNENKVIEPKGMYGGDGKNAPSLQLKENHTFIYTDLTKTSKPIRAEGTWSIEDNELVLESTSKVRLNKRYTFIREGKCIKTRKNFAFYTLCNCSDLRNRSDTHRVQK
ncbi:hypothetical protein [Fluviicola taffensis]|uniref:Uncharacterized protein n=1 Tax=Fluviicola taffensis (strain DSM 16823 / NCIMB 13979 / RW262) TaxID=755732 RepID=F2ICT3_FLUTR|nr:hypothetical protein [Fluviicola taffensis]AEA43307.1 hypothetical protein Fluta_1312 [Fluviicola taffensis DSM 16823]